MFYLPTCERSKLLAPKFQEAAHLAREFGVKFGVVDAWNEYLLLDEHNIELDGYPTIKYFDYETKEFRDYPEKLHGYYTSSQDFVRVAINLREIQPNLEINQESSGLGGPSGVSGPIGIFSKIKNSHQDNYDTVTGFPEFMLE